MDHLAPLPATPHLMLSDDQDRLLLACASPEGLLIFRDDRLERLTAGPISGAAPGPQGGIYFTREQQIYRLDPDQAGAPVCATASFGGPAQGLGRVVRTPDRSLWVEGCPRRLDPEGVFHDAPPGPLPLPAPLATDLYANAWCLHDGGQQEGAPVLLSAAQGARQWRFLPSPVPDRCQFLITDTVGYVWTGNAAGLWRLDPHQAASGWRPFPPVAGLPATALTALALSPDGLALAGYASGELFELDIDADGQGIARPVGRVPGAVRQLHADAAGCLWVATDRELYRQAPAPVAWQHSWQPLARLPGGNHDLFGVVFKGRLFLAGGLTSGWGFPARTHVFDALLAYDPQADRWLEVARLPFPRCYNGIAVLEERLWIVGGAANRRDPDNPEGRRDALDNTCVYDPRNKVWTEGPRLHEPRLEPIVATAAGRIYVAGGSNQGPLDSVESIGPGEHAWLREPDLPVPLSQAAGCVLDGLLYCIGRPGLLAYDPAAGAWIGDLPQLDESPQAPQVAAFQGEVWVMGGSRRRTTHRYSPRERCWRPGPDLPTDQSWGAAAELDGRLIVAGGAHWSPRHRTYIFDDRIYGLRADGRTAG